ncbi:Pao retrotransposon peptidase superfamily [Trichinella spiralis]|uniref:Pao retrotransposon peptidase superfamily n=1 Tax=Trichinella spiralis TaxID=6334 RepID=UPI0001EFE004|nr:Pao retrotransposon peptidase superfamily [Trichinella spiralis]
MENLYQGQERRRDTFGRILAFLFEQARIKDTDIGSRTKAPTKGHQQEPHLNARKSDLRFTTAAVQMESDRGCAVCKGDHLADRCPRFRIVRTMAHGEKGRTKLVNCLLDSGSERSLIRSDVADELDLQGPPRAMTVKGVNGLHVRIADVRRVQFRLTPIPPKGLEPFKEGIELTALSLPSLCDDLVATPTPWFCKDKIPSLPSNEITPGRVQIDSIIGLDVYFQVLGQGVRRGGPNDPVAIETIFGWIVCGPTTRQAVDREETTLLAQTEDPTEDAKAEPALTRFEESVSFDGQRYSVGLLWKPGASPLPNKLEMAKRRLRSLRHRLARDPDKEREYADVIQSYLDQGWAEEVPDESGPIGRTWYLPHHAVYQDSPGKAKCRVVFDGSAEMNGASLNRCFEPGPKLQPDLVAILLRFRRSRIGIQADIEKMYLQIGLRPEDRDVCRFLWQAAGSKSPARIYRLTRALWFTGIEWDDPLPAEINGKWISWKDELERLSAVRVQCALVPVHRDQVGRSELHVYGDASEAAYGAVAYLLTQASDGVPQVLAKARVGPIKRLSLPRLELIASLLATRLKAYITKEMGFSTDKQVCWSDSSVALSWIKGDPRKWKTFVANRVQEIIPLTEPSQWRYVPTADNPADRLSRGCTLERLLKEHLWWNGPDWLQQPKSEWPRLSVVVTPEEVRGMDPERRDDCCADHHVASARATNGDRSN